MLKCACPASPRFFGSALAPALSDGGGQDREASSEAAGVPLEMVTAVDMPPPPPP